MGKVIIHIGGNKTASTTLQNQILRKQPHNTTIYLGQESDLKESQQLERLIFQEDYYFLKENPISFQSHLFDKKIIISNEDIMGSPETLRTAKRLKKYFGDASIVMIIRNQYESTKSWYVNHGAYLKMVPKNYWKKHVTIDEWLEYCFMFPNVSPLEAMNYLKY